jgi:hypothetical protein
VGGGHRCVLFQATDQRCHQVRCMAVPDKRGRLARVEWQQVRGIDPKCMIFDGTHKGTLRGKRQDRIPGAFQFFQQWVSNKPSQSTREMSG